MLSAFKLSGPLKQMLKVGVLSVLGCAVVSSAFAADPLMAVGAKVSEAFGSGSTFMWILMVCEVIAGIVAYIKTKNMLVLTGIIVVFIFTAAAFALIGAAPAPAPSS